MAKIDGYIFAPVQGGGRFVGEKRPVRIEEPAATAKAVLLDDSPREANGDGDDALESKPRRRGRRGGRPRFGCQGPGPPHSDLADMYVIVKTGGKQHPASSRIRPCSWSALPPTRARPCRSSRRPSGPMTRSSARTRWKKIKVEAKILGHERGPKLRVFKFKPKRGYKKCTRSSPRIQVTKISNGK